MCAALTGGSHQVPKAGRASIEGRGIHLHRLLVATTLHGCKEQRFLPLFSKTVSFSLEKENHQKKKERGSGGVGIPIVCLNILDPWSMPSLLTTTKALWRYENTLVLQKRVLCQAGRVELCCPEGKAAPAS